MIGLLLLICIYFVLGFLLVWIAGVVAREEVEVKTGVLILVLTGIVSLAAKYGMAEGGMEGLIPFALPVVNFGMLIVMLNLVAKLSWKHSAIIAAVYTGLLIVVGFALASCSAD